MMVSVVKKILWREEEDSFCDNYEEEGRLTRDEIRELSSSWLVLSWDGRVEVVVANWV
jgi:hypothetical protein